MSSEAGHCKYFMINLFICLLYPTHLFDGVNKTLVIMINNTFILLRELLMID